MSSPPSSTPVQVQTSSTGQQQVVMSPTTNLHGVSPVLPQGSVLMQQTIPASSLTSPMNTTNLQQTQSPSKVTIINNNNQKGSSSLSQLSLLAQHPQGHGTTTNNQIHIKPSGSTATVSKAGTTIQRQVLPVQSLPGKKRHDLHCIIYVIGTGPAVPMG